jgi:hypothetical protein
MGEKVGGENRNDEGRCQTNIVVNFTMEFIRCVWLVIFLAIFVNGGLFDSRQCNILARCIIMCTAAITMMYYLADFGLERKQQKVVE